MIDRKKFYDNYRNYFGKLFQKKVDAINFLLDKLEQSTLINDKRQWAYVLATVSWETADTYLPITEMGSKKYLMSKKYYPYIGRGYVQLTWKWNYQKFEDILKIPLVANPQLANEPETAWKILEYGMANGSYTGKKLSHYFNAKTTDYLNARRIINGMDRATLIKNLAVKFYNCL